jgi:anti-sigma-K factor RskA
MDRMEDKLDSLWAEYREACPDPEPSAQFMPQLWQRIEASRNATTSLLLRRWTEVWLVATVALAVVMGAFLIPHFQTTPAYQATYIDVLLAADSANDIAVIPVSENR